MSDKYKFNAITGKLDLVEHIPQVDTDPASPRAEDAWVLKTQTGGVGGGVIQAFLGLGWPMLTPGAGGSTTYDFSYRTKEGTTVRIALT